MLICEKKGQIAAYDVWAEEKGIVLTCSDGDKVGEPAMVICRLVLLEHSSGGRRT